MSEEMQCRLCGASIEKGAIHALRNYASVWNGPKISRFKRKKARMDAYRCTECGYVELSATELI